MVTAVLPDPERLPADLETELAQLDQLSDEELWQVALTTAPAEKTEPDAVFGGQVAVGGVNGR